MNNEITLSLLIFAAAVLYSSVGHGGASGYLAAMALFGLAPTIMRPSALALNILVASIGMVRFYRAGYFSWQLFWPFALTSIPLAFLGGTLTLPDPVYKQLLGTALAFAALRLLLQLRSSRSDLRPVPVPAALLFGAAIGLLSGLTGVGGGIFLSPLLLFMGWAETRGAAAVSAAFILVNSMAGLAGQPQTLQLLPSLFPLWLAAALLGSLLGTELGTRRLASSVLRALLAAVLVIATLKLVLV